MLVINFLRLIHAEIILKKFTLTTCEETEKQTVHTSEERPNHGTNPMPTFAGGPSTSIMLVEFPQNLWSDSKDSKQDHPEFPIQEEGQSRGTESPERGHVSTRETSRLHDLRLFLSGWCS